MNKGLGRGLSSLIPQKSSQSDHKDSNINELSSSSDNFLSDDKDRIVRVNPKEILANPEQPRQSFNEVSIDELVESIREYGIIQPLIATRKDGKYELIAGERRLRAAKKLGFKEVPVIVRDADQQEKLEIALIENIQRENLNPIETALSYRKLIDEFNLTQDEMAKKLGKSRPVITNSLRFLNLPEKIKQALINGKINEGHAKYLLGLDSEAKQMTIFNRIVSSGLTVRDVSKEVRKIGGTKKSRIKINYKDKDKEFAFREFFGTRVEVRRKGQGGQVIIDFFSDEELDEMTNKIK